MASYEEAEAGPEIVKFPDIVSDVIPGLMRDMRLRRLASANLLGGRIHSVNWQFRAPGGAPNSPKATISLTHPNFYIPNYDRLDNQSGSFKFPASQIDGLDVPERNLSLSSRLGGVTLTILGVDVFGDKELLGNDPATGLIELLGAADQYQMGCMNVVAYIN